MRSLRYALAGLLMLAPAIAALGQTAVQQSATQLNAGISCQVAANPAVATANTLTFAVPASQSFYLTSLLVTGAADATGGAVAIGRITTTNLQSVEWDFSTAGTASTTTAVISLANSAGLIKSAVGPLNATIVSPSSTHIAYGMTACGYFAP